MAVVNLIQCYESLYKFLFFNLFLKTNSTILLNKKDRCQNSKSFCLRMSGIYYFLIPSILASRKGYDSELLLMKVHISKSHFIKFGF